MGNEIMKKHSTYHIETDGFEKALTGAFQMMQTVPIGMKCRVVLDYDPALPKVTIETFMDKSNMAEAPGRQEGDRGNKRKIRKREPVTLEIWAEQNEEGEIVRIVKKRRMSNRN